MSDDDQTPFQQAMQSAITAGDTYRSVQDVTRALRIKAHNGEDVDGLVIAARWGAWKLRHPVLEWAEGVRFSDAEYVSPTTTVTIHRTPVISWDGPFPDPLAFAIIPASAVSETGVSPSALGEAAE